MATTAIAAPSPDDQPKRTNLTTMVYSKIADPLDYAERMAKAASSMMQAPVDQGMAIALTSMCEGITLVEMRKRYHWIQGRPVMQAAAMLSEFRMNWGGQYNVKKRSPDGCEIDWVDAHGNKYETSLTWEEVQESRWPWVNWKDHSKGLKDNWATPLDRKTMIFSRLVSDSLKFVCPELAAGVYTPEEMQDVVFDADARPAPPKASEIIAAQKAALQAQQEVVEEVVTEEVEDVPFATEPAITDWQANRVQELFDLLGVSPEKAEDVYAKRGCTSLDQLTFEQAAVLITNMEGHLKVLQEEQAKRDQQAGEEPEKN